MTDLVITDLADLAGFLAGGHRADHGTWRLHLVELVAKADHLHRSQLATMYPRDVLAWEHWVAGPHPVTRDQLAAWLDEPAQRQRIAAVAHVGLAAQAGLGMHEQAVRLELELAGSRAEMARLRSDRTELDAVRMRMAALLDGVAAALKGEPGPQHLHDWSDLPEVAAAAAAHVAADHAVLAAVWRLAGQWSLTPSAHTASCPERLTPLQRPCQDADCERSMVVAELAAELAGVLAQQATSPADTAALLASGEEPR
jgi:hypothetical protein